MPDQQKPPTLSSSRPSVRWPWWLLLVALPFFFLTRMPFAGSEPAWTGALLVITACVMLLFCKVSLMASTPLGKTALRLYLTIFSAIIVWLGLNMIRYLTYNDAVEGRTTLAVRLHWFVTARAQPAMLFVIAATAILFLITALIATIRHLSHARSLDSTHV